MFKLGNISLGTRTETAWAEFSIAVTPESKGFFLQSIERFSQGTHQLTGFKYIFQDDMNLSRHSGNRKMVEMVENLQGERVT